MNVKHSPHDIQIQLVDVCHTFLFLPPCPYEPHKLNYRLTSAKEKSILADGIFLMTKELLD